MFFDVVGIALIAVFTFVAGGAQSAFVTSPALIAFDATSNVSVACFAMWTDVVFANLPHAVGESGRRGRFGFEAGRTLVAEVCRRAGVAGFASLAMRCILADGAMSTDASGGRAIDSFTFAFIKQVAFGASCAHALV